MKYQIKNRWTGDIIHEGDVDELKTLVVEKRADLSGADLYGANLSRAKIAFHQLPSIRLLSSIPLDELPDNLTLELMRRDAWAHPYPKRFDDWAKGGPCPYRNEERWWIFKLRPDLWRKGKPQMRDSDLILAICKAKGWKIVGYD